MHTFEGKRTTFCYNSDFSGTITIFNRVNETTMEVSADDLFAFVLEYIKSRVVATIEDFDLEKWIKEYR